MQPEILAQLISDMSARWVRKQKRARVITFDLELKRLGPDGLVDPNLDERRL